MTPSVERPIRPNPRQVGVRRFFTNLRIALARGSCFTVTTTSVTEAGRSSSQLPIVDRPSASVTTSTVVENSSEPASVPTQAISAVSVEIVASEVCPVDTTPDGPRFFFRSVVQQEKITALFAKYGIPLEPGEWSILPSPTYNVQWVEKPVRLRIRRHCHRCQTTFGLDRTCKRCEHKLCKKCPRFPPKKAIDTSGGVAAEDDGDNEPDKEIIVSLARPRLSSEQNPSWARPRTGGSDLVRRPVKQKIRRTCHQCNTLFARQETVCRNCQHTRCTACPRDPPKAKKWPHGYPGDVEAEHDVQLTLDHAGAEASRAEEWSCHECTALVLARDKVCTGCQHTRCAECTRHSPILEPPPDPHLTSPLEERVGHVTIRDPVESAA